MITKYKTQYQTDIYILILLVSMASLFGACSKEEKADYYKPVGPITVSLDQTSVSVGTPLKLNFTGIADSVIFYSGKEGHKYEYRDRTEIEGVIPSLSFTSSRQWGNQENTLKLLISRDFVGNDYSKEAIDAATWEDITHLAVLDDNLINNVFNDVPSGSIDLTSFISATPVVIAFRYVGATGATQKTWTIKNLYINSLLPSGISSELVNIMTADWTLVPILNPNRYWTKTNSQLQIVGGNATFPNNDTWAISKPIYLNKVTPDQGEVIKSKYQFMARNHWFVYDEPGTYKAVVVGKSEDGEAIFEFDIVVE